MQNTRFQLMHMVDAKLCFHLMVQNSFRNIERQKNYRSFLGDRLELWPSIFTATEKEGHTCLSMKKIIIKIRY